MCCPSDFPHRPHSGKLSTDPKTPSIVQPAQWHPIMNALGQQPSTEASHPIMMALALGSSNPWLP
jgi:hypothetical protein